MHLLDTDTLTYLHAGHPRVEEHLRRLDDDEVAITVITRIEVLRGRFDFVLKAATGTDLLRW
jgi:tRNA(fMet)-specific endonuclease VapC